MFSPGPAAFVFMGFFFSTLVPGVTEFLLLQGECESVDYEERERRKEKIYYLCKHVQGFTLF